VQTVRSSFNNVNASISSINAYQQAVVSAQSSLDAPEAGYQVGTRTIVDVLDATSTLYNAKQQLSSARYTYLINQLNIKSALGTLNENDLMMLNGALGKPISTSQDVVAPPTTAQDAYAEGYNGNAPAPQTSAPVTAAPVATRASAPATTTSQPARNSGNPFLNSWIYAAEYGVRLLPHPLFFCRVIGSAQRLTALPPPGSGIIQVIPLSRLDGIRWRTLQAGNA